MKNKKGFTLPNFSKKNLGGFTLIELLIVIAIISILAAAVIIGINPARNFRNARNATRWNQMNVIATAVYSYAVEHGGDFPPGCIGAEGTPIDIITDPTDPDYWCCDAVTGDPILVPDYTHALPKPPQAGEVYQIQFEGEAIKITSDATEAIEDGIELIQ